MKKFEPHYRLVRYGQANKIEKASRQQREFCTLHVWWIETVIVSGHHCDVGLYTGYGADVHVSLYRQAEKEPLQGVPWNGQDQGCCEEGQEINGSPWDYSFRSCGYGGHESVSCCMARCAFYLRDKVRKERRFGVDAQDVATSRAMKADLANHHFMSPPIRALLHSQPAKRRRDLYLCTASNYPGVAVHHTGKICVVLYSSPLIFDPSCRSTQVSQRQRPYS